MFDKSLLKDLEPEDLRNRFEVFINKVGDNGMIQSKSYKQLIVELEKDFTRDEINTISSFVNKTGPSLQQMVTKEEEILITPLIDAILRKDREGALSLLDEGTGGPVNFMTSMGYTAIDLCREVGMEDLIPVLVSHGAVDD